MVLNATHAFGADREAGTSIETVQEVCLLQICLTNRVGAACITFASVALSVERCTWPGGEPEPRGARTRRIASPRGASTPAVGDPGHRLHGEGIAPCPGPAAAQHQSSRVGVSCRPGLGCILGQRAGPDRICALSGRPIDLPT